MCGKSFLQKSQSTAPAALASRKSRLLVCDGVVADEALQAPVTRDPLPEFALEWWMNLWALTNLTSPHQVQSLLPMGSSAAGRHATVAAYVRCLSHLHHLKEHLQMETWTCGWDQKRIMASVGSSTGIQKLQI